MSNKGSKKSDSTSAGAEQEKSTFSHTGFEDFTVVDPKDPAVTYAEDDKLGPDTILDAEINEDLLLEFEKLSNEESLSQNVTQIEKVEEKTAQINQSDYQLLSGENSFDDLTLRGEQNSNSRSEEAVPEPTQVEHYISSDFVDVDGQTEVEKTQQEIHELQELVSQDIVGLDSYRPSSSSKIRLSETFLDSVEGLERFGPYVLLKHMGIGGMSEVRLALKLVDHCFEHVCVIKRMFGDALNDHDMQTMFADEMFANSHFEHPNIVKQLDSGSIDSIPFIAMDLVDGVNLSTFCKWHPTKHLALNIVLEISRSLARALHCFHSVRDAKGQFFNFVHRDVSPQNILIDRDGSVKLSDFGIARFEGRFSHTKVGTVKGKQGYASPEHLRSDRTDYRSDIFSLGTVMVELCTGRTLFPAGVARPENLEAHVRQALAQAPDRMPAGLTELLVRMTANDPEIRPASAEEVEILVETILETVVITESLPDLADRVISARYPPIEDVVHEFLRWSLDWPTDSLIQTYQDSDEVYAIDVTPQHVLNMFHPSSENLVIGTNFFPTTSDFAVLGEEYFSEYDASSSAGVTNVPVSFAEPAPPPSQDESISGFLSDTYLRPSPIRPSTVKLRPSEDTEVPAWFVFTAVLFTFAVGLAVYVSIRYLLIH